MDSFRDLVWRVLLEMGIQLKFQSAFSDAMPLPKRKYLVPFDETTWNELMNAIDKAKELWKSQLEYAFNQNIEIFAPGVSSLSNEET
jgi:hypothetical protein